MKYHRAHPRARRLAECLVRCACRRVPARSRDECYREWAAEVAAILDDPAMGAPRRIGSALLYAADTIRGTLRLPREAFHSEAAAANNGKAQAAGDLLLLGPAAQVLLTRIIVAPEFNAEFFRQLACEMRKYPRAAHIVSRLEQLSKEVQNLPAGPQSGAGDA